jgi:hypothetical protein
MVPYVSLRRPIRRVLREPVVHFLVLGAALFVVGHYLEERSRFMRIDVTKGQVRRIAESYRLQYGTVLTAAQLEELVGRFITEETVYRAALKLGLDRDDEVVRRRLIQKYEFLQQDLSAPREPTDSQLLEYYQTHLDQYQTADGLTFKEIREDVRRDYVEAERNRSNTAALAQLREQFKIVRE